MREKETKVEVISSSEVFRLSEDNLGALDSLIHAWKCSLPLEGTWVRQTLGVPSLFVRIEAVMKKGLRVLNISGNAPGIGLLKERHNRFSQVFDFCAWPNFRILSDPDTELGSDQLWLNPISETEAARTKDLLLIKSNNGLCQRFAARSVVTVGDSYQSLISGVEAEDIINLPFLRLFFLYSLRDRNYLYAGGFWRQKRRDDKVEIGLVD